MVGQINTKHKHTDRPEMNNRFLTPVARPNQSHVMAIERFPYKKTDPVEIVEKL